jgi:anti-anti-sigma factor
MTFPYTLHNDNHTAVIRPEIPLESRSSGELKSLTEQLLSRGVINIIIDAERTDYVSSEGLHTLFTVHRRIKSSGGSLLIARPSREARSLFLVIQLSEFMPITDTIEEAMNIATAELSQKKSSSVAQMHVAESDSVSIEKKSGSSADEVVFETPLVVECESCNAFIRVGSSGLFMCPSCKTEFSVTPEGTVVF